MYSKTISGSERILEIWGNIYKLFEKQRVNILDLLRILTNHKTNVNRKIDKGHKQAHHKRIEVNEKPINLNVYQSNNSILKS